MSVIACKVSDDLITVASDSIIVSGNTKYTTNMQKLIEIDNMVVGGIGTCEESFLFFEFLKINKPEKNTKLEMLELMASFASWKKKITEKFEPENAYILVFDEKVYALERFFVKEIKDFWAIGAGQDYALTALALGHSAIEAVEIACRFSCYCEGPVIVRTRRIQ